MRNSMKVAKWEIKRNITNKSFIISLIITPIIFMIFFFLPSFFSDDGAEETINVYVLDEINMFHLIEQNLDQHGFFSWNLQETTLSESDMKEEAASSEQTVYIALTEEGLEQGRMSMYLSDDVMEQFQYQTQIIEQPLRQLQLEQLGLTEEQKAIITNPIVLEPVVSTMPEVEGEAAIVEDEADDIMKRIVPGIFAGIILFSIVMTGMMIFQSASQEKKEKVAEIVLSSVTPGELMQGKIIGYFVLGMTQVLVWIAFILPLVIWKVDIPIMEYLLVPELLLLLFIAFGGYLLFAAIFAGLGATVEEMTATSNFQAMIMMLPFLPFLFFAPILNNPEGIIAKVTSYIPFTSPGILILRLSIMDEWPWVDIIIGSAILLVSIWLFMKIAGRIFKVGILMYGKNATPKEIWKWMWT